MNAGAKVGAFLAGLLVVGAAGAGLGALAGPIDTAPSGHRVEAGHDETSAAPTDDGHDDHRVSGADTAEGTEGTDGGYRLALEPLADDIRFRVLDPEGAPVVETEVVHEKPLHLIVVGRDLTSYAHLHPEVDAEGTWSVARPDLPAGSYRVVADLTPGDGPALALAADLVVLPEAGNPTTVDDLTVTLDGHPEVGDTELAFTVTRGGEPVEPEPYLGARGHLVAFRADDLAYSHVHPHDGDSGRHPGHSADASPAVEFTATFPAPGAYRLFLDLQVDGVVHTFPFTVEVHDHEH